MVKEVLQLGQFAGTRVISGHSGLDKQVCGVGVLDIPDALNFVRPGDIVFTTGYFIRRAKEKHTRTSCCRVRRQRSVGLGN